MQPNILTLSLFNWSVHTLDTENYTISLNIIFYYFERGCHKMYFYDSMLQMIMCIVCMCVCMCWRSMHFIYIVFFLLLHILFVSRLHKNRINVCASIWKLNVTDDNDDFVNGGGSVRRTRKRILNAREERETGPRKWIIV